MSEQQTQRILPQDENASETEQIDPPYDFWDNMLDSIPPWGDEVLALTFIIVGILSFLSVLGIIGDASIPRAWASSLNHLFGYGSLIVSGGILAIGVIIVLNNIGIVMRFPTLRIIALEFTFLSSLALLHIIASGSVEMRAVARAGAGGGLIGWTLSAPASQLLGATPVTFTYSLLLLGWGVVSLGISTQQLVRLMSIIARIFNRIGENLAETPAENRKRRRENERRREIAARRRMLQLTDPAALRIPIVRVRPDLENIPPSLRPGATPIDEDEEDDDLSEHPLFSGAIEGETFNIIGERIGNKSSRKKSKSAEDKKVRRPDGRVKRYFEIGEFDEERRVGRRKKDYPPLDILQDVPLNRPDEEEINTKVVLIENTLLEFDVDIDVVDVNIGPTVTQFSIQPFRASANENESAQRTRISKIASYQSDLALALSAKRLRIEAPIPGTNYVGIEVPNNNPSIVALRSVYESRSFNEQLQKAKTPLLVPLGRDVSGEPFAVDLASLPHTLVAGTTGSGKSVCLAAFVMALLLNNTPDELRLVMLDPKMVELTRFNGIPHLMGPVETDQERILGVLRWCTREMDDRYQRLEKASSRNIMIYNQKVEDKKLKEVKMPYIVILIDEVGDLMMTHPDETEHHLTRLAQMARAVGMHLIVATQRPSVDILTGLIKANFPGRIAFSVASGVDSRVILDASGAENLLGRGDMLYLSSDASGPRRLQGCYVSDDEVRAMVQHWQAWAAEKREQGKLPERTRNGPWEKTLTKLELLSETDELLEEALEAVVRSREASAAMLQKHLNIGFPRASRIMDLLHELGAIGPPQPGGKMRKVLISSTRKDPMAELVQRQKEAEARKNNPAEAKVKNARPNEYFDDDDDIVDVTPLEDEDD